AGVAHVGRERLGEERAENRAIARPDDRETDHHRDQQPREGLLVHHPEEGEGVQGHRDGAADEHLLSPRTPPNPASCTTPTDQWPPPSACRYPSPAGGRSPSSTGSSWPGREPPSSRESSATASRHPARRRRATAERARLVAMSTELLDLARTIALEAGRLAARRRREGVEVAATKSSIV